MRTWRRPQMDITRGVQDTGDYAMQRVSAFCSRPGTRALQPGRPWRAPGPWQARPRTPLHRSLAHPRRLACARAAALRAGGAFWSVSKPVPWATLRAGAPGPLLQRLYIIPPPSPVSCSSLSSSGLFVLTPSTSPGTHSLLLSADARSHSLATHSHSFGFPAVLGRIHLRERFGTAHRALPVRNRNTPPKCSSRTPFSSSRP